jgi:hypothetical protein
LTRNLFLETAALSATIVLGRKDGSPHPLNGMLLAGILGLCVLLGGAAHADAAYGFSLPQQAPSPNSDPSNNSATSPPAPAPSTQQPPASSTQQSAPSSTNPKSSAAKKAKKKTQKEQPTNTAATEKSKKKVVTHGGTDEPTTQISPSMTEQQAAKTRSNTAVLLNETESNLQKLSGRSLTADQKETADQVRQFVEQSKAADQSGDLQRAASLANKAKLLSDALIQP